MSEKSPEDAEQIDRFAADWTFELSAFADPDDTDPLEVLEWRMPETIGYLPSYDAWEHEVLAQLREATTRWLVARRAEEETWRTPTQNDRITAALRALGDEGIVALEHAGLTIEDGWAHVGLALRPGDRGAVFFHQQDVLDALESRSFALAFGAFDADPTAHDRVAAEVARRALDILSEHEVSADWSGSPRDRIEIEPFVWQKRRFTTSPSITPRTPASETPGAQTPGAQTELGGLWRSRPERFAWRSDAPYSREECVQPVFAKYDTFAFDRHLSWTLRGAWTLYAGGRGHVHHHGLPHVFVRAGEVTTLWPGPALENLACDDARELWQRAVATRRG